ncbi:MAG: hypothetical protein FJ260_11870, partial [Planctomycetes bacterium]|nr:hypothetical protein [Planctomycetota bacterium]
MNYWPDAFNDQGMQLRVVPNMEGHLAQGPPRFAWLGARWQSPDVRNVTDRRSALPELRHSIMVHAEILRRHGSSWQDATGRIRDAIRKDSAGEFVGQVADAAVPFGGLLMKLFKGAANLAKDRLDGPRSVEQAEDAASKTLVDEVCECLHSLVDGAGGLPTVLWLDDAPQEFVRRTWRTAQQRNWPLLVVVTHWEREWRELKRAGASAAAGGAMAPFDLSSLDGEPGVDARVLNPSSPDSLAEYAASRLPGLTPSQRALLLEKAAGNFLTMVENVGDLLCVPQNFVDRDVSRSLSSAGEREVGEWAIDRQMRGKQRFTKLAPELQELLGWGSYLGVSFLREVVEEYAEGVPGLRGAPERLREAVDPLVILGEPSEHLREFRDRAFHHVARRHFAHYGMEHAEALDEVLRERAAEWVNRSFDGEGNEVWPNEEQGIPAPPRSVTGLTNEEARDMLGMAAQCLRLDNGESWDTPMQRAALRTRFLQVILDARDNLWSRVRDHCTALECVKWSTNASTVISHSAQFLLLQHARNSGALTTARNLAIHRLSIVRARTNTEDPESLRDLGIALSRVGDIELSRGQVDEAYAKFLEYLTISHQLAQQIGNPQSLRDLGIALNRVAAIEFSRGQVDEAYA